MKKDDWIRPYYNNLKSPFIYDSYLFKFIIICIFYISSIIYVNSSIQGEAHKVLQINSTQIIDHIQKCFRRKFQCLRRPSYWATLFFYRWRRWSYVKVNSTFLNGTMYFFSMILLPILRRIQRPITEGHSSHAKYENSWKIETYRNNHFQRIY